MDADGKTSVGEISQLIRVDCELCCCPIRTPIRYSVNMKDPSSHSPVLVSILPMFYRGIPAPCQCCHAAPATLLTGVQMIDSGRKFTMTRGNFQTILSSAGQPEDMEMQKISALRETTCMTDCIRICVHQIKYSQCSLYEFVL